MYEEVEGKMVKLAEGLFWEKVYSLKCTYLLWDNDIRVH